MRPRFHLNWRTGLALAHDAAAAALAWCGTYWLRFNLDIPAQFVPDLLMTLIWVVPLQAIIFIVFGLYRGLWRFASLPDLKRIVAAVTVAAVAVPLVLVMFRVQSIVPRSVLLLDPVLMIMIMGGSRFAYRAWKEHRLYGLFAGKGEPVLVLGAGEAGSLLVKELSRTGEWRVVGLLDDDTGKHHRMLQSVEVLGALDQVGHWAKRYEVRQVIIALPGADSGTLRRIAQLCAASGLRMLILPSYEELIKGKFALTKIRQVELDDLLGRAPVTLNSSRMGAWLGGRVVLVTGAGGSIGSELCRQIALYRPARIALVELSEYALYRIGEELHERAAEVELRAYVADVKNEARVRQILEHERPSVIFHAAAYKHVPLMEQANAWEAVRNNAFGTYVLACAAVAAGIEKFVLVSTDKAVNPTNVMGASKRLAEMLCQSLQNGATRFVLVRFGNVLGSAGSVIPKFREQIERGGPLTVTHPQITRYFMSIPEAAQLVMQAGYMGEGGQILVLDMGESVKIVDLARDMIRLSGRDPDEIAIAFVGLRPGEKLHEELLTDSEATLPTPHPKLRVAQARPFDRDGMAELVAWLAQPTALDDESVRTALKQWVPEYAPSAASTDLERPAALLQP